MASVLLDAEATINGPRRAEYGSPLKIFTKVEQAAKALGLEQGNPLHHPMYMTLVKLTRLIQTPDHRDSIIDWAGYAGTYEMVLNEQAVETAAIEAILYDFDGSQGFA